MNFHFKSKQPSGFTLVELMVVMAIVAILVGMISIKFRGARPLEAAQIFSGLSNLARVEAIRNGAITRVAIQNDLGNEETHLRKTVVLLAVDDDDDAATDPVWKILSMKELPVGTLLDINLSGTLSDDNLDQEMKIDVEELSENSGNDGLTFIYHEFDSVGQCESSFQWVFTSGTVQNGDMVSSEQDLDGFIIRKTGQSSFFSTPEQITSP